MNEIAIDIGYSETKVAYNGKFVKFPTSITYANSLNIDYGNDNVYQFEDENYYVGDIDSESFTMTDYNILSKFAPLVIYHILKKFDEHKITKPIVVKTGLAIADWTKKNVFIERISEIKVNDELININPVIVPQGAGLFYDFSSKNPEYSSVTVIDIGSNTINLIHFKDGQPIRKTLKGYPNHGVSTITKTLMNFLEQSYGVAFSPQESNEILVKEKFIWNGVKDENVTEYCKTLKSQFVQKLFRSVLVNEKKLLSTSEVVVIGGGGAYMFEGIGFPPNVQFVDNPYEYANVRGYSLI
jgi:hypothetical protein